MTSIYKYKMPLFALKLLQGYSADTDEWLIVNWK